MHRAQARATLGFFLCSALAHAAQPAQGTARWTLLPGVVVEEVGKGSAADRAGIKPGDILLSWERAAKQPANPNSARGEFRSPFDVREAEIEQSPRGRVVVSGTRAAERIRVQIPAGRWQLITRPDFSGEARRFFDEGEKLLGERKIEDAIALWRGLQRGFSQSGAHTTAARLLLQIGDALCAAERCGDAEQAFDEAVQKARLTGRRETEALVWRAIVDIYDNRDDLERTRQALGAEIRVLDASTDENLILAEGLHSLGNTYPFPLGDQFYRRALSTRNRLAPGSLEAAGTMNNLAECLAVRGDLAGAEGLLQNAVTIFRAAVLNSIELATVVSNLGVNAWERGDLAAAEDFSRQGLAIRERLDPSGAASSLHNLAGLAWQRRDLAAAERLIQRAQVIRERLNLGLDTAKGLIMLGEIQLDQGNLATAEASWRRAVAALEKTDPESEHLQLGLLHLGLAALQRENLAEAKALTDRAFLTISMRTPDGAKAASALNQLGEIAREGGDAAQAEQRFVQSLAIRQRMAPNSLYTAEVLHSLGMLYRDAGRMRDAASFLGRSLDDLEGQRKRLGGGEESASHFDASYRQYYQDYLQVLMELNRQEDALHVLERSRARSLLAMLAERDLVLTIDVPKDLDLERRSAQADYDLASEELSRLNPRENSQRIEDLQLRLQTLRQTQSEIANRIKKASPKYAALQYPQPLNLAAAQAALDEGTLLLSYSVGKEKSFLFVVSSGPKRGPPLSVFTLPVGEKALRESVEAFRRLIEWNKPSPQLLSRSRSLYDTLLKPAEALIGKNGRLLILPDGPLHTLPWAALVRDVKVGQPQYLVEWKPIHTAVSATVYAELRKSRRPKVGSPAVEVAAFGDPRYPKLPEKRTSVKRGDGDEIAVEVEDEEDAIADPQLRSAVRGGFRFEPLPASRKEVEQIASLYAPKAAAYLGSDATEEKARAIGKDVPLIHYACHAYVNERFPLDSALVFTIPDKPKEGQDNGLLQAWEIFEKVRIDADLVTLSACESGLGKEMGGEGLIGLTRAFQYAGARSVLASLWKVEDESTGELMKRFYQYLKAGKTKDEALRLAQIDLIHSPDLSQPIHWAAFELIGDWK